MLLPMDIVFVLMVSIFMLMRSMLIGSMLPVPVKMQR